MFKTCYYFTNKANRKNNEDKFQINKYSHDGSDTSGKKIIFNNSLISISDGMGGEAYGDFASEIVTKELARAYNSKNSIENIKNQISNINNLVVEKINLKKARMGATLVSVIIKKDNIDIINVGDSRAYLYAGKLIQLSKDHSLENRLTQHIGMTYEDGEIEPFIIQDIKIKKNDYLLMCSDGLYNMVSQSEMENIFSEKSSVDEKVKKLFNLAMRNGGKDNITFLIVKF